MKTIIILSGVKYKSTKQRPQHMAVFFANKGYRVIYMGLPEENEIIDEKEHSNYSADQILNLYSEQTTEGIYILKKVLKKGKKENEGLDELLIKLETYFIPENVTFIVAFPDWVKYLNGISSKCKLIYDCIDDWESFVTELDWGYQQEFIYNERKLASLADLVITSARSLYLKMATLNSNVYYLPNGVWNLHYNHLKINKQTPKDLLHINKPIIFFMGAIAGWVDIDLIRYLAENRPNYSFVFVGAEVKQKLPKISNIYFLGHKNYEELPLYLGEAKLSIIPFKINKLTVAVTPLKFYEYLSSGTPVVTTMMPDLLGLEGAKVAINHKQFLMFIDEIITMDDCDYRKLNKKAVSTSLQFDWEILIEPLCRYIDKGEKINIETNAFICNTIQIYQNYRENMLIQNELIQFYNYLGEFENSLDIICNLRNNSDVFEFDYNHIALTYLKTKNTELAMSFIKKFIENKNQYRLLTTYFDFLMDINDDILLEIIILKLCGRQYEALKKIEKIDIESSALLLGLVSGLYFDIGEFEIAVDYAVLALNCTPSDVLIKQVLDPYIIKALINQCIKTLKYDLAEELAFSLLSISEELDKMAHDILGNIYLLKYSN